ncbi:SWIB/MDM2 domain-containing protein [Sparassis latifolia]|uniref:DM2 domain-containing protein n=1 Tax=Sparassis crispa TaxID=139825 RepID=A0A401GGP6_9APHY|nr:hypothetical protein SCP_0310180 [Sparassis crispa]GBE81291.1 hypothetical protein SCP_0310180 [Sparassis crispa]
MSFEVNSLEHTIREILSAPGTNLETISAKRVRKQLLELVPSLTPELVKENKDEIDVLIGAVFRQVKDDGEEPEEDSRARGGKRSMDGEDSTNGDVYEGEEEEVTPPPKAKKARKGGLTDAELARQLSHEINGRPARASAARGRGGGAKRGGKRGAKSAATVDTDGEGDEGGDKKPKKKRGGGFQKEYKLDEPLSALLNVEKLSRPQVVKQLWDYIKAHNLQNPENKKEIICDDNFKAIFNVDKIDMFKMNKVLGQHLDEP